MSETKIDRLCRTCMNDSNSHSPIYRELFLEDSILFEVINDVCQLEVTEGDGLPEYICHDCLAKLSEFQKFKCRAHEVNVALQRMKEHELNSESESLPWESSKTEDESKFEQENDGSDIGSKELCGSTLALHHDWIKPDYGASEHENDDVNPSGVDRVEVKVEPEDSFDEASDGREDTPYEEYIGIEPDDLAYNAVRFDGTTPAATDPLQVPVNVTELKQESFSPERSHPTKDTFLTDGLKEEDLSPEAMPFEDTFLADGLKEEDLSPEAMPVQVIYSSTHGTLEEEEAKEEPGRKRDEIVMNTFKDIGWNRIFVDKSEEANSTAATGRFRKTEAAKYVQEGERSRKSKVYKGTHEVVIQNVNLEKKEMMNSSGGVVTQDSSRPDTHLGLENQTGDEQVENLYCKRVAWLPSESTAVEKACPVCWKAYKDVYNLEAHMKKSHPDDDEGRMLKPWVKQKRFLCDTCGKGYDRRGHLAVHMLLHSGVKLHKCDVCSKTFARKQELQMHTRFHRSEKPHECHLCEKKFSQRSNLKAHLKTHEGPLEKKFGCTVCGKRYTRKFSLEKHLTTHSDEKPFLCNYCGKTYKLDQSLKLHLRRVHGGEKRFGCDICRKEYFLKAQLIKHILSHGDERPYACEVCEMTFKTRKDISAHQRIHSALKLHSCSFCSKAFLSLGNLKQHIRIHTGERPFECPNCGKKFNQSSSLGRHRKSYCKGEATI